MSVLLSLRWPYLGVLVKYLFLQFYLDLAVSGHPVSNQILRAESKRSFVSILEPLLYA